MIYFIGAGHTHPIKVGYTRGDVNARLKTLQAGNHEELYVVAIMPGDLDRERRLHDRFAPGRLVGEWFRYDTPGLSDLISAAIHFEGFYPEDKESELIRMVLAC